MLYILHIPTLPLNDKGGSDNVNTVISCRQLSRGHLLGRLQKQLADLYLLMGQLQQAGRWYRAASEDLKHHKDWLWMGGAYEGLSVTAMMTKECERVLGQKAQGVDAPSSLAMRFIGKVGASVVLWGLNTIVM